MTEMNFVQLYEAVAGNTAAIRHIVHLLPAGGQGSKVFPPTPAEFMPGNKDAYLNIKSSGKN
jgi:hypothetical protein